MGEEEEEKKKKLRHGKANWGELMICVYKIKTKTKDV